MTTTTLPIAMDATRKFSVFADCGTDFFHGEECDGFAVVIELRSKDEAKRVLEALLNCRHEA